MQKRIFPGILESLPEIGQFIAQVSRAAGLDDDASYQVELAVDEACTNIIEHAYGRERSGVIICQCEETEQGLQITLRDTGKPFNPKSVPEPDPKRPLKKTSPRGAGLYLMRKLMDEVEFNFDDQSGNTLTMLKRVP